MRLFKAPALAVVACLAAACQATSPMHDDGSYKPYSRSGKQSLYFPREYDQVKDEFANQLVVKCRMHKSVTDAKICMRRQLVIAFDTPQQGLDACGGLADFGQYSECIGLGSAVDQMRQKIP